MASFTEKLDNCEVCAAAKAKYTCPRCEVRTCGLACVNIHKKELECDGIRDKTKFVPLDSFTDLDLLSDYRLLEGLGRSVEQLQNNPMKKCTRINNQLPLHLLKLKRAAYNRGVNLEFMPQNFCRHKENTTYFKWKENELSWKLELIFPQAENVKWVVDRVVETKRLSELLEELFYSEPKAESNDDKTATNFSLFQNKLKFYRSCGLSGLKVLLKAEKVEKSNSRFYELDLTQPLKENLRNKTIIEYPIVYVILKDHSDMFDIIDSDEEIEETEEIVTKKIQSTNSNRNKQVCSKKMKKEKTDSAPNYFFNADSSESEDEVDDKVCDRHEKQNNELQIPDYNELVKIVH